MNKKKNNKLHGQVCEVVIDPSLDRYENMILFPEKLAKANKVLKTKKLPPELIKTSEEHFTENHGKPGSETRIAFEKKARAFALTELLLNGPVFTEDQIKEIEETHKSINRWRDADPEISG
ncbi:hypothetical protein [Dyadobacter sp. CY323]|uniref:hypothetical protein n=1 Tax=Dyadobacter sp. CY323 TaxID=2907302 RepID=UPI001F2CCD6C|nr:hypothetical protein [Dyadobacter sp. CY323]MCE6990789.1 hypothetical protein [Dyadobacter sp. CY323]